MRFINPKTDFAFKKIFGSDQSKAILISFLNAVLYQEQPVIADLEIINPYLAPKIEGMKDTYVDVRARLRNERTVIIEMQVLNVIGFEKRVLYNAAKAYSTQLPIGGAYEGLRPVVALTITDFVMFPEHTDIQSAYVLQDSKRLTSYPEADLELVFVELPKFTKPLEQLVGVKEKWLYFLRNAPSLELVPQAMGDVPEINQAFELANQANLSPEELDVQERKLAFIRDHFGSLIKAEQLGLKKGLALGIEQGLEQGLEQGRATGREEMAQEMARRAPPQLTDEQVAELTGLPTTVVAELRAKT